MFASPKSSVHGDITHRSCMQYLEDEFQYFDKELKELGINSANRKHENDPSPNTSNDSGGSKNSHLTNRNQYCIKNKIEGEIVVSDEIVNTPGLPKDLEIKIPKGLETAKNSPK